MPLGHQSLVSLLLEIAPWERTEPADHRRHPGGRGVDELRGSCGAAPCSDSFAVHIMHI